MLDMFIMKLPKVSCRWGRPLVNSAEVHEVHSLTFNTYFDDLVHQAYDHTYISL